jgi:two-component system, OmpR family, response regulator RegX3
MSTRGDSIRVLVVEDDESYREAIAISLRQEGFDVELAANGVDGLNRFMERLPDIVLLDNMLPGMRGFEVCRRMRSIAPVPVLIVSAVTAELDVVLGLELGASDYVTKPFHVRELVARMHAIMRRVSPSALAVADHSDRRSLEGVGRGITGWSDPPTVPIPTKTGAVTSFAFGNIDVDIIRREVTVGGDHVHMTRREFDLLVVLLSPARHLRTRDELIDLLWPHQYLSDSRTLDTHIHRLRSKLEPDPTAPRYIVTVRGVGFRLDPDGVNDDQPNRPLT